MGDETRHNIKGYELRGQIGAGSSGVVYRAYQPAVDREVAIKVILPQFANQPEFIRRFEVEAQLVARLEHPHIVPLFDFWRDPDGAYLVMRWLPNNLRAAFERGAWSPAAAARLLDQLAAALTLAHRDNIIHRDIKPDNILLDEDENAYLADFSIAKDLSLNPSSGSVDENSTAPEYISPEQIKHEPLTARTDIYSLGFVLYELLSGERAFPDATTPTEFLSRHLNTPLPPLRQGHGQLPAALDEVLQTATAKDPAQRYANVLRFAAAFRAALPVSASRTVPQPLADPLTERELDVLNMMVADVTNEDIADKLVLSLGTVRWYIKQIYSKLDAHSRQQAIDRAQHLKLANLTTPISFISEVAPEISISPRKTVAPQLEPVNPYKGLRAFQEADTPDFFGRAALVERLLNRLAEVRDDTRLLVLIGPSGSGKSSLVNAGLIPALRQGALAASSRPFIAEMLPGTHPLEELEAALLHVAINPLPGLLDQLREDRRGLVRAAKRVLPSDPDTELILVIDQFEELFTLVSDEAIRAHFIENLLSSVTDPRGRVRIILTLRADFYDRPLLYPRLGEVVRTHTEVILPLTVRELEQAIQGPAERVGVQCEPGLALTLINESGEQPGVLPLLQYALTELFEQREGLVLTNDAYKASGGVLGALARRADELFTSLDSNGQAAARQMFLRLITLGEGVEDTRRRTLRSELASLQDEYYTLQDVIDLYGQYRLLTFDRDSLTRGPTVEIAHEALIREWGRLREWLRESRDALRTQRRLMTLTEDWSSSGKEQSYLASGARLIQFEDLAEEGNLRLNQAEQEYLNASMVARERQEYDEQARQAREIELVQQTAVSAQQAERAQRRAANRLRYLAAVLMIFLLVAAGLSLLTLQSRNDAINSFHQSESQRLGAESASALQRGDSPELAALLAISGLQSQYSPQADAALQKAARFDYGERVFPVGESVNTVAFSPDGRYALTEGATRTILWDVQTGVQLRSFALNAWNLGSAAFSPDNHYIIAGDSEGTIHLWETATGVEVHTFSPASSPIDSIAISPDGHFILTASDDQIARLMDITTGTVIRTFSIGGLPGAIAFSPDNRRFAVSNLDSQTVQVWDVETESQLWSVTIPAVYTGVAFSPDGQYVLATSFDMKTYLLDASTGQEIREFVGHTEGVFSGVFSPDGRYVLTGSLDQTARLWDTATGEQVRRFSGHTASVYWVAFSPDGRHILTASRDTTARLWDIEASPERGTFTGAQGWMNGLAFSSEGNYVLTGTYDNTAHLFDTATGRQLQVFTHSGVVQQVFFSPDSSMILTGNADGIARLWVVATGEIVQTFDQGEYGTAYSPNGRLVLTSGTTTTLWDAFNGESLYTFDQLGYVSFSPDSAHFAVTDQFGETVTIFESATGTQLNSFHVPARPLVGEFSPDGMSILTGGRDNIVRLWDADTGQLVRQFVGHTNIIWTVAFSPDGSYILSGSQDRTARLWDTLTGEQVRAFPSHNFSAISMVDYSPDGQSVLIGSSDGTAQLANVDVGRLIQSVCARLLRDFTDTERTIYSITDANPACPTVDAPPAGVAPK